MSRWVLSMSLVKQPVGRDCLGTFVLPEVPTGPHRAGRQDGNPRSVGARNSGGGDDDQPSGSGGTSRSTWLESSDRPNSTPGAAGS